MRLGDRVRTTAYYASQHRHGPLSCPRTGTVVGRSRRGLPIVCWDGNAACTKDAIALVFLVLVE